MTATIFEIKRFAVHDGDGIRTTVFFKGCPLRCVWCHNPESQRRKIDIAYYGNKCIKCGACAEVCENGCHLIGDGVHVYDRNNCISCGKCGKACFVGAIESLGRSESVENVIGEVEKDKGFYKNSGGGLTVSGGEPLMQAEFLYELLSEAKKRGIHTCLETCGFADKKTVERIAPLVDIFLYDIKETDENNHKALTGVSLAPILENLRLLDSLGAKIILRCPIIPGKNMRDTHLKEIAELAASLKSVYEINVMAFHTLGSSKYDALSMHDEMKGAEAMSDEIKNECIEKISKELKALGKENIKVC